MYNIKSKENPWTLDLHSESCFRCISPFCINLQGHCKSAQSCCDHFFDETLLQYADESVLFENDNVPIGKAGEVIESFDAYEHDVNLLL